MVVLVDTVLKSRLTIAGMAGMSGGGGSLDGSRWVQLRLGTRRTEEWAGERDGRERGMGEWRQRDVRAGKLKWREN